MMCQNKWTAEVTHCTVLVWMNVSPRAHRLETWSSAQWYSSDSIFKVCPWRGFSQDPQLVLMKWYLDNLISPLLHTAHSDALHS